MDEERRVEPPRRSKCFAGASAQLSTVEKREDEFLGRPIDYQHKGAPDTNVERMPLKYMESSTSKYRNIFFFNSTP